MLSTRIKVLYGIGQSSQGIKDGLFQIFLFFYFSQVLGLDAALAGVASVITLLFDAVSDPMVGILSDKWKSAKWGRRHPLMMLSALPLGLFTWLLFLPPAGMGQMGLFLWLTAFGILVRLALTLFIVPHISLGAELTEDYNERTIVTSYRVMFGSFIAPVVMIIGFTMFFVPTEDISYGLFNQAAYPRFAFFCGILMIFFISLTVWGTREVIPGLPKISDKQERMTVMDMMRGMKEALKMKSYWSLISYMMIVFIGIGIGVIFTTYFATYYFQLTEQEFALLPISSALGGIVAMIIGPRMGKRMDKKKAAIISTFLFGFFFSLPFNFRLIGFFPDNGTPYLLPVYILSITVAYSFLWVALSLGYSMMAEVIDEYELSSGTRQEGLFFSALSFAYKCTTGIGMLVAGLLLNMIAFPKQAAVEAVPQEAIYKLGLIGGPLLLIFYWLSILLIRYYPITNARYKSIREQLNENHGEVSS
jgi:glycoside/pentoside/hexuronide:cation symporter, GPH family